MEDDCEKKHSKLWTPATAENINNINNTGETVKQNLLRGKN